MSSRLPGAVSFRPALPGRAGADGRASAEPGAPPPVPRHRRRSMLALGVVLAGLGALAGAWVFTSFSHRVSVLEVTRNLAPGTQISAADLAPVTISAASGVKNIPARQEG